MPVASLARILEGHWSGLIIGPPVYDQAGGLPNMVVYPLFPTELGPDPPDLISLSQGLRRGVRLRDTGMVGQVHVDNPLPTSVLVGESELLVGPTQRRAIQFSCLVPPHRRASLPVNCVEAGQPTVYQAQFTDSEACPWQLRSFKLEQLARHGETHQHRIWDRIDEYLKRAGTTSSSRDIGAVFGEFGGDLESLARAFPHHPSQVGAICAVGQELFVEVYDTPELLEDQYDRLLRSALVEAVAHPGREVVPPARVHELPAQLAEASVHSRVVQNRSLRDTGRTQVFSGGGLSGSALTNGGQLLHLSAHQRCWGKGRPFADQIEDLERHRSLWFDQNRSLLVELERQYARRRRQYQAFKGSLSPEALPSPADGDVSLPDWEDVGRTARPAPRPLPLHQGVHEFFVRLFRQS